MTTPTKIHWPNGQLRFEEWNIEGQRHRLDGPAFQGYYENGQLWLETWATDGERHRVDGPAYQEWHQNGQLFGEAWYIEGEQIEPISDPLAWAMFVAKNFGNVHGLEKFCLENIGEKAARAILASVKLR